MLNLVDNFVFEEQTVNLAITQGKTYQLTFNYPSDLTGGVTRGQIRDKYLQDSGAILATFNFNINYDNLETKSLVIATISAEDTASISYTKYQGNGDATIRNCWVYDIEYEENGVVLEILRGLVQVKAEVTE
jgi:hypothetical protein